MRSDASNVFLCLLAFGNVFAIFIIGTTIGFSEYAAALIFFGNFYFNITVLLVSISLTVYLIRRFIMHEGGLKLGIAASLSNVFVYLAAPILATVFLYSGP